MSMPQPGRLDQLPRWQQFAKHPVTKPMDRMYIFQPPAVEYLGQFKLLFSGCSQLENLGCLWQWLGQHFSLPLHPSFNSVTPQLHLLRQSFWNETRPDNCWELLPRVKNNNLNFSATGIRYTWCHTWFSTSFCAQLAAVCLKHLGMPRNLLSCGRGFLFFNVSVLFSSERQT